MREAASLAANRVAIEELISADALVGTPASGLPALLHTLSDEAVDFHDLVAALGRFPNIAARLLAVANSAWCGPVAPIATLRLACAQLGLRLTRSIGISLAVSTPFNRMRCPAFDVIRFWHSSLLAADVAEGLAACCRYATHIETGALRTAGLLHNLGLLWLADKLPRELTRACELVDANEATSLNDAIRQLLDADICRVSGLLLDSWGLPSVLVAAITDHRSPHYGAERWEWAALLGGAVEMASFLRRGESFPASVPPQLDRLGIPLGDQQRVFQEMSEGSEQLGNLARSLS